MDHIKNRKFALHLTLDFLTPLLQALITLTEGQGGNATAHACLGMDTEAMQPLMHPQGWP